MGNIVKAVVFLGVGFVFVYLFLIRLDSSQKEAVWSSFAHADYWWVGCTMCVCLLSHWVRAMRWRLLYEPMGYRPGLNNVFGSVLVAYLANLAFPRLGEVLRCATLRTSDGIPVEKSLGTVVTERCVDILAFGVVVLLGLLCMYGQAREWLVDALAAKSGSMTGTAVMLGVAIAAQGGRHCAGWRWRVEEYLPPEASEYCPFFFFFLFDLSPLHHGGTVYPAGVARDWWAGVWSSFCGVSVRLGGHDHLAGWFGSLSGVGMAGVGIVWSG